MNHSQPVAIVSAILIKRDENNKFLIFTQERWKPNVSPMYSGMVEIPAGGIDSYENVYDTLRREVKEECGLDIINVIDDFKSDIYRHDNQLDSSFVFKPFICQQVLSTNNGLPWIGFVFVCEVDGIVAINDNEARNPQWLDREQLENLVNNTPEKVFPLQLPVLRYFLDNFK